MARSVTYSHCCQLTTHNILTWPSLFINTHTQLKVRNKQQHIEWLQCSSVPFQFATCHNCWHATVIYKLRYVGRKLDRKWKERLRKCAKLDCSSEQPTFFSTPHILRNAAATLVVWRSLRQLQNQSHYHRRLLAVVKSQKTAFVHRVIDVGFVGDKVALRQVFIRVLRLSPVSNIPTMLHSHSCITCGRTLGASVAAVPFIRGIFRKTVS